MKLTFILLVIAVLIHQCVAIVRTEYEANEWLTNKDSLASYFNKYKVSYDKKVDHTSLVDLAKSYKDAATSNMKLFGGHIDDVFSQFGSNLNHGTPRADLDAFLTDLKHQLRQLELKGLLTKERVAEVLDKARAKAIHKKIIAESDWEKLKHGFEKQYEVPTTWYQRIFNVKSDVDDGASSLNQWVHITSARVGHLAGLTKEQTSAIKDQLRQSVANADLFHLGDKAWMDNFVQSISQKTEFKKDQINKVIDSISKDVNGYKIFALDYTGQAKDHVSNWVDKAICYLQELWKTLQRHLHTCLHRFQIKKRKASNTVPTKITNSVKSFASSVHHDMSASIKSKERSRSIASVKSHVSSVASHATSKLNDINFQHVKAKDVKDSFAHFWKKKEHDAYRKLGYTEAHIDWIQHYLEKSFANKKTSVKGKAEEAAAAIKRYLDDIHIQSPAQNEANVHKLKRHLESWRTLI